MVKIIGCIIIGVVTSLLGINVIDSDTMQIDLINTLIVIGCSAAWLLLYSVFEIVFLR